MDDPPFQDLFEDLPLVHAEPNDDLAAAYWDLPLDLSRSRLRIGHGANVPRIYAQAVARLVFFRALYAIAPETTTSLLTEEALAASREFWSQWKPFKVRYIAFGEQLKGIVESSPTIEEARKRGLFTAMNEYLDSPVHGALKEAQDRERQYVQHWMTLWNLADEWIAQGASQTLQVADFRLSRGEEFLGPLVLDPESSIASIYSGRLNPEDEGQQPELLVQSDCMMNRSPFESRDLPVYLERLMHPPIVMYDEEGTPTGESEDEGLLCTFKDRTDSVDVATEKVLDALRPRVRAAVESIASAAREYHGDIPPIEHRTTRHFNWLVHYQALKQDMVEIAEVAGVSEQAVSAGIHKAKDLIDLTLRERSKPGPKRGSRIGNRAR